jgi:hypothetical protein
MITPSLLAIAATLTLGGATATLVRNQVSAPPGAGLLRVTSGTPGHEVAVRGVLLFAGHPMRVVEQSTPFEFRAEGGLTFAAFEAVERPAMLTLELRSPTVAPAAVTAPRVMIGRRIGGVATEFVQGY